jgi:hypothetical protein
MANEIVVIKTSTSNNMLNLTMVFWYPITSGQLAITGTSAWANASAAENTAIQNGSILEEVQSFSFPVGLNFTYVQFYLLQYWTNRNADLGGVGPGLYENAGYNGSAWVANIQ